MGRQSSPLQAFTYTAEGAVAAYRGVGFNGAQATVAGQKILGVSQRAAASGEDSDAVKYGSTLVESGGEFAVGDALVVDSQGRAVVATALAVAAGATPVTSGAANGAAVLTGGVLPSYVFADALAASGGAGEIVEVLMR